MQGFHLILGIESEVGNFSKFGSISFYKWINGKVEEMHSTTEI
jgi:hypothetical protein